MMLFSQSQRDLIAEAIVSVIWTKSDMIDFLQECNVPTTSIARIESLGVDSLTKRNMLKLVFNDLNRQANRGTPQFRLMAERLCQWTSFNPRWFGPYGTLDKDNALDVLDSLRTSLGIGTQPVEVGIRDTRVPVSSTPPRISMVELKHEFERLIDRDAGQLTAQQRGFQFESLLNQVFSVGGIPAEGPFRTNGLQIDGAFKFNNHYYLLEAKWSHSSESAEPLLFFGQKVGANMDGRGLFISINGFTNPSIMALTVASVRNVILMDGLDLHAILDDRISISDCLEEKVRAAQTRGALYFDPVSKQSKTKFTVDQ